MVVPTQRSDSAQHVRVGRRVARFHPALPDLTLHARCSSGIRNPAQMLEQGVESGSPHTVPSPIGAAQPGHLLEHYRTRVED